MNKINKIITDIVDKIISFRESRGWSQAELGRNAGLTSASISYIESGRNVPSLRTIIQIAKAFNIHASKLFYNESSKEIQIKNKTDFELLKEVFVKLEIPFKETDEGSDAIIVIHMENGEYDVGETSFCFYKPDGHFWSVRHDMKCETSVGVGPN